MYRMFYYETTYHKGKEYKSLRFKKMNSLKNINKYDIYYLTDLCGFAIIDNRKRGK